VKQKENIFEELNKMRSLIHTKAGTVISEQANIAADVGTVMRELGATFNADEEVVVNTIKKYKDKASFKSFVDQYKTITGKDFGAQLFLSISPHNDKTEWNDLKTHLATMGITLDSATTNRGNSSVATFAGLDTPAASGAANTEEAWKNPNVSCVTTQPDAKKVTLNNGSIGYRIGTALYYSNGRKQMSSNQPMTNYSCSTEFKSRDSSNPGGRATSNAGGRANVVSGYSKELQTSLGVTPTGQLSDADIDLILKRLEGGETGGATPSLDTQSIPMDANGQPDIDKIIASL
jgi:hypothetical protein